MSKVLRTLGMIAGAVALAATGVGAIGGAAFAATATGATVASVASIATVASLAANLGSALTYKQPQSVARGSVTQVLISTDAPQPYAMGEGYCAGVLRHDCAYGGIVSKVPNPYRWMVMVYSGSGPVESITPYVDQATVSSWYGGYLQTIQQLGLCPEPSAMTPGFGTATGWDSASKLSGYAAIGWNLLFDKAGERFGSGLPQFGAYGKWVKVYDPRKDGTRPGGVGSHRLGNESTYEWSENPALHAGMYAYGRYQNGKRVMGVGIADDGIDWAGVMAWANVCDANGWKIFGVVYEPGNRWQNLQDICQAGGGTPYVASGMLSFNYWAPRTALDVITEDDLAPDADGSVTAMRSRFSRVNTIVPKYRSPSHNWEMIAAANAVTSSTYVTEDGGERRREWMFNFVKSVTQASQLAAYVLADARELQPIQLTCGYRVRDYGPGDCLTLYIPSLGLNTNAVVLDREYDHATMQTKFTFIGETEAKHAWALGLSGVAPPTGSISYQTGEERDLLRMAARRGTTIVGDTAFQGSPVVVTTSGETVEIVSMDVEAEAGDYVEVTGTVEVSSTNPGGSWLIYFDEVPVQAAGVYAQSHNVSASIASLITPGLEGVRTYSLRTLNTSADTRTYSNGKITVKVTKSGT